ncbi:MAG: phage major capsid protein [Alphaproteobacteria bacterium]|nr:phage major capsid protein [Alphaproteobacteria bacterium]
MKKLAILRQRLATLKADGEKILGSVEAEDRVMTEAETEAFDVIEADIKATQTEISGIEAVNDRRRIIGAISPALGTVVNDLNPETTGGFKSIAEFAASVKQAGNGLASDGRLQQIKAAPTNFHEGGAASGEGYMVPTQFRDQVWEVINETDDLMSDVDLEPTNAREVKGLSDETTPWGSAGVTAAWRSEGTQMTAKKLATEPRSTPLHELYSFVLATEELLEDAPRLANRITRKAGLALAWKMSDSVVYGTGSGQPLGWFNSPALVSVAKEAGQAADTIESANVLKMYARLLTVPGDTPYWLTNTDTLPQLATLTIGGQPVWTPPVSGLTGAPGGFLLGRPIRFSEHAKTLGDKGDLQLVSPKGYYAARRTNGPVFASSMHLYFDYAMEAFRWMIRFGGQPHLSAPVNPANGSATKSHFITLDERA